VGATLQDRESLRPPEGDGGAWGRREDRNQGARTGVSHPLGCRACLAA